MTLAQYHPGASKKSATVEAPPAPAPLASEKAAPEQKVAVMQTESIKCDSGWDYSWVITCWKYLTMQL